MNLETNAKLYIESKLESNIEQSNNNVEACTSVTNLEQQMDGETSMPNSDGIPTMHENTSSIVINTSPATQAPNSVSPVNEHIPADHANEQSASQTCSFKMEKPKMPKFTGDVREYAIFRAGFKRVWVMVECRGSRVIGRGSRVISRGSRVIGRGSKVEVEGQKSRSRVKSRGRGSKVEGRKSKILNFYPF